MPRHFVLAAALLLSGCSTMSGPEDLFGYATPQPGVLASAPDLVAAVPAIQPLPPAPDTVRTGTRRALPAAAPLPTVQGAVPTAAVSDEDERERMIASALEPASSHRRLGDLDRNADGTMILPEGRSLEIIDIAPIRNSMMASDDLPAGL